ncbi:sensor histidine kinase [Parvibaculum sp. MBR-TMA-1.3b-4.2]
MQESLPRLNLRNARASVPVLAAAVAVLYALLTPAHYFLVEGPWRDTLVASAGASGLAACVIAVGFTRDPRLFHHPFIVEAVLLGLVVWNTGLHQLLLGEPKLTTNAAFAVVGLGLMSHRHEIYFAFSGVLIGSVLVTWRMNADDEHWSHFLFGMLIAAILSGAVYAMRLRQSKAQARRDAWQREAMRRMSAREAELASALRRADELAEKAQEGAVSKSSFLASMSHELRTPLTALIGFSELLKKNHPDTEDPEREYIGQINENGQMLLGMINDLLDVAKADSGRMVLNIEEEDLEDIVHSAVATMKPLAAERRQHLAARIECGDSHAMVDIRAMKQILLNLIGNAVKYTQRDGTIEVALEREGRGFVISVTDNGRGIEATKLKSIFDPFEQVDNSYDPSRQGTGLGLYLVKTLTEMQGGSIHVESEPRRGSSFAIFLPALEARQSLSA